MTYEDFWQRDPWLVRAFVKADEYRIAAKNRENHRQAAYNMRAFRTVIQEFSYGLNGGNGKKPHADFPQRPVPITDIEEEAERQRRIKHTLDWVAKGQK